MMGILLLFLKKEKYYISIFSIIILNFIFRYIIYSNTNLFYFGDFSGYLNTLDEISNHQKVPLIFNSLHFNSISYIGYFFKHYLGDLHYFFIFNCLVGALSSLISLLIIKEITKNKTIHIVTILIQSIYFEFICFSSIFYTPVIMIFLLNLFLLFLIKAIKSKFLSKIQLLYFTFVATIYSLTLLIKPELVYIWIFSLLFILILFVRKKDIKFAFSLIILSIFLIPSYFLLNSNGPILNPAHNHYSLMPSIFFGHTKYGKGEFFVQSEYQNELDLKLKNYLLKNNITTPNDDDLNKFRTQEVKDFVLNHPLDWATLQFKKLFFEYGSIPQGESFKILFTGIFKDNKWLTFFFLQIPFCLIIIIMILTFDLTIIKKLKRPIPSILFIIFIYYMIATVFFTSYAERYRMPVVFSFLIPLLSWSITNFSFKNFLRDKKLLYIKLIMVSFIMSIWIYQLYDALVIQKDRYNKVLINKEIGMLQKEMEFSKFSTALQNKKDLVEKF